MSGPNDICDPMLPQQPMIVRAFDKCYRFGNEMFKLVTNPYSFEVDGVQFLGTSGNFLKNCLYIYFLGQNVHDLLKYTRGHPPLEIMRQFIEASYLFPTCPDTLDGFPIQNQDPFIIEEIPHVFFAGNQNDFEVEKCTFENGARTLLMALPKFSQKQEAVLLNIKTLETQVFRFDQTLMN
jgi:DNA polymerase delta subunit 2